MKKENIPLHPLPIRIWHWLNAVIVFVLVITGIELRFTDIKIFSDYGFVVALHKYAGYALTISFFFWIAVYQFIGGFAGHYLASIKDVRSLPAQVVYYLYSYFRGGPNPFNATAETRFNILQKLAYSFIMFIAMPAIIASGIIFGNIIDLYGIVHRLGGLRIIDAIHVIAGYIFIIYLFVHLYMATLGKTIFSHTRSMFTGKED
ncbi:MAG: cytochrome b561 [Deltaproteobacteria bacterium]|nr:cytochrome b561 [Deltaproteobacteria bacterium]